MPMMDMCRQMMGDMMRMPMMGGAAPADPKEKADMLEMRGENDESDGRHHDESTPDGGMQGMQGK